MDAFSEVLASVRLNGALFFNAEFSAPWGVVSAGSAALAAVLAPKASHILVYHFVVEGSAVCTLSDGTSMTLSPGDVIVFPHGDSHLLANGTGTASPEPSEEAIRKITSRDLSLLQAGGGGERTRLVCGFMVCDPYRGQPILGDLPQMFKVNIRSGKPNQWLEQSILYMVEEAASGNVGGEAILSKLAEALFVEVLRRYIADLPDAATGWLAGSRDAVVGRALQLIHRRVAHPWTLASLASEVGVSRSAFVERFTRFLSEPPMSYLTRLRLQLAARSLQETSKGIAEISAAVGYESEFAFSRAFKRDFGAPPARYRRQMREAAGAALPR